MLRGGGPLHPTHVGEPGHADLAGAPGLGGGPFDHVVAIGCVVNGGIPLAFGFAASAQIDHDHRIAIARIERHIVDHEGARFVIRRAFDDRGKRSVLSSGQIDIGGKLDAVAHGNAGFEGHPGIGRLPGEVRQRIAHAGSASVPRSNLTSVCTSMVAARRREFITVSNCRRGATRSAGKMARCCSVEAGEQANVASMSKLEGFVLEQMQAWDVPGVAIGIFDGDDVEFAGFGITQHRNRSAGGSGDIVSDRFDQQDLHRHAGDDAGR